MQNCHFLRNIAVDGLQNLYPEFRFLFLPDKMVFLIHRITDSLFVMMIKTKKLLILTNPNKGHVIKPKKQPYIKKGQRLHCPILKTLLICPFFRPYTDFLLCS